MYILVQQKKTNLKFIMHYYIKKYKMICEKSFLNES